MLLRKGLYLLAEFLLLYAFVVGGVFLFFHFGTRFDWVLQLIFGLFAVIAIPWCAVMVVAGHKLVDGFQWSDLLHGVYQPTRPLAALIEARSAIKAEIASTKPVSEREGTEIWFTPTGGETAHDVLFALSKQLKVQGIPHSQVGGLKVRDQGTLWGVNAAAKEPALLVWVETDSDDFQAQVVAGIEAFISDQMGLALA